MNIPSSSDFEGARPAPGASEDATRFSPGDEDGGHDFDLSDAEGAGPGSCIGLLGEYLLLEQIGVGGMGHVYRAEHRTMNRLVAVKVLASHIASERMLIEQFFAEIRAVAKLMHPNIVTAFDAGSVGDTHYLVMELVEGEVLSARIRRQGPLDSAEAVNILQQAAQALQYAHSVGIVHRDIKPSNMMLTGDGTLKILDFGLARLGAPLATEQHKNIFMGTPEYMSPEQIEDASGVDGRSDLYSLGATLFYLLTGRSMFSGDKMQVAVAQIRQKPPALFIERSDIDLRLDAIFQRLVEKRPENRYSSAAELLAHMQQLKLTGAPAVANALAKGAWRLTDSPTSVALSRSTLGRKSQIVAIDLGMRASTAAYYCESPVDSMSGEALAGPRLVEQGEGGAVQLRNMLWSSAEQFKIGSAASAMRQQAPREVIHSVQRWIGARELPNLFCGSKVPPQVALGAVLRQIMLHAATATENALSAIVTVPGCYDQIHRRAIRDACRIAGINLLQLLDKSLAGALSWHDVNSRLTAARPVAHDHRLLFVHLGGTGLEASILQTSGMSVRQLGCQGSWKHGSLRWQHLLAEYFVGELKKQTGRSIREDLAASTRLERSVEMALERLTQSAKVEVRFEWAGVTIHQTITQRGLVKIAPAMVLEIEQTIARALELSRVDPGEIDYILLAGSMTRMKPIREIVLAAIPHRPPVTILDKADFARGAAIHAHHLATMTHDKSAGQLHAISHSTYDFALLASSAGEEARKPRVLLEKSTLLPATSTRTLRPKPSGDNAAPHQFPSLKIIESTSLGNSNWNLLAQARPDLIFPERSGDDPLQLRFEVDESGVLQPSLLWPGGNRQVLLATCDGSALSEEDLIRWNQWLDSTMLCSTV